MAPFAARLKSAQVRARRAPIRARAIERELGTRFTADTLAALVRRYPARQFVWLMGADNLAQFHRWRDWRKRSEEHTSELQSLMRISYAVFCLKKKKLTTTHIQYYTTH